MRPRSGLALRHGITVLNSPGTIDSDYRGEVMVLLANLGEAPSAFGAESASPSWLSQRVERASLVEVDAAAATARGAGGFGSTGRKSPSADRQAAARRTTRHITKPKSRG